MMVVSCVFRIHRQGEILQAWFDTESGSIVGFEDLFTVDMEKLKYYGGNYAGNEGDSWRRLCVDIINRPNAVAVIGYNRIGAVIVERDKASVYNYELQCNDENVGTVRLLKPFKRNVEVIGEVKTKVEVYSVMTPQAALVVDKTDKGKFVYTRLGKVRMDVDYDSIPSGEKINMGMHSTLLNHMGWYAICTVGGVLTPLQVKDGSMIAVSNVL